MNSRMVRYSTVSYSNCNHRLFPIIPLLLKREASLPLHSTPAAFRSLLVRLPTNLSLNLVNEELWTCGPNNTVNGERLEYFLSAWRGSGENRCGSRGPLESNPLEPPS